MKAFVTGATGLLGNNLIRMLAEQGYEVKALARSRSKADRLFAGLDVTTITGDMTHVEDFAAELEGCDILFHAAAYFRDYFQPGNHWQMLETVNVHGTKTLLEQAALHGIKKVIYVSSIAVLGKDPSGQPSDESTPPGEEQQWNLYYKSKLYAEEVVQQFLSGHNLPVALILPAAMFGPGDIGPTSTGLLIQNFLDRKLPGIIDAGLSVVDARDVAQAMIAAVEKGKSGERYIVGGRYYDMGGIYKALEQVSGVPAPTRTIPYSATLAYAWFMENMSRITHKPTLVTLESIRTTHLKREVSSQKAMSNLAVTFRPFEETLRDEIAWYRAHTAQ